jgi:hypothetical protein
LEDKNPPQGDGRVEGIAPEIVLGVKTGPHLDESAHVVFVHVIDANHAGHALQMARNRRAGAAEIEPVVVNPEPEIDMAVQKNAVGIGEGIPKRGLLPETSAPVEVALKDVTGLELEQVAGDSHRLFVADGFDLTPDRGSPGAEEASKIKARLRRRTGNFIRVERSGIRVGNNRIYMADIFFSKKLVLLENEEGP